MLIKAEPLQSLVGATFKAAGCSPEESARIAHYLVAANRAGHDSHGVIRVPRYVLMLKEGQVKAGQTLSVLFETEAMAMVDGQFGFGQTVGPLAVELGIAKAARGGSAIIGLRNAGHLGRIGDFAEMAAAENQVSIHFVNVAGSLLVAPFGGIDRRFSTAPFAAGVPRPGAPPIILDFATSMVAEGKALVARNGGKPLPGDALIGPDGEVSGDPMLLYGPATGAAYPDPRLGPGALRAMGEHKGSGLALFCELLGGALTGSGCAGPGERPLANGMLSIYLATRVFDQQGGFAAEVRQFIDFVKSARPATPGGEVLVPGEPELRTRAARDAAGIPLSEPTWHSILDTARAVGLDQAAIDAALAAELPRGA